MKNKNIKMIYSPIGGAMKFKNHSRTDGSSEYYYLLWELVRNPSIEKVYLIQKSDYQLLSPSEQCLFDPRGVLVDFYSNHTRKEVHNNYKLIYEELKDIDIDFAVINMSYGFYTCVTIPDIYHCTGRVCKVQQQVYAYSGAINYYLSNAKIPWFMIQQDPRYHSKCYSVRDCLHIPLEIWGQRNDNVQWKHMTRYDVPDLIWEDLPVIYNGWERLNAHHEKTLSPHTEKTNDFVLVAMQSAKLKSDKRFKLIKQYILDNEDLQNIDIYGKWEEDVLTEYKQFKGLKTSEELNNIIQSSKYTLVIPIKENFVSSKWIEMISLGILPFMVPEYDMQYNTLPENHILRIKDAKDLKEKIDYFNAHDEERIRLLEELQTMYIDKSNRFVSRKINEALKRNNIDILLSEKLDYTSQRKTKNVLF